jgi:hypothetical protein
VSEVIIPIAGLVASIATLVIGGRGVLIPVLHRVRYRRIRRAYRVISRLETKVAPDLWSDLRVDFANDTMRIIDFAFKRAGASRTQRRQMKRRIVNSRAA